MFASFATFFQRSMSRRITPPYWSAPAATARPLLREGVLELLAASPRLMSALIFAASAGAMPAGP
jgi:hypothetical protein